MEAEEEELEGPLVELSLRNVKGLAVVLQAIKPGSKQVRILLKQAQALM